MRRIWSGARTHLRNGKPISIEGRRRKRRRETAGDRGVHCVPAGRGDPPRFRPAVSAGIRRAYPCDAVCLNERVGRAPWKRVERSRARPIPRRGHVVIFTSPHLTSPARRHFHTPPRQDRRRSTATRLRNACRAYAVTREATDSFPVLLRVLSLSLLDEIILRE